MRDFFSLISLRFAFLSMEIPLKKKKKRDLVIREGTFLKNVNRIRPPKKNINKDPIDQKKIKYYKTYKNHPLSTFLQCLFLPLEG